MAQSSSNARRSVVTRILAAAAMVCVYFVGVAGVSSVLIAGSTTSAEARGRGRGGGRGRGVGRGRGRGWARGRGRGWGIVAPGCYYSPRWGRVICPY
ncbi:MAG TPA: hypothetical protein VL492_00280 [Methylovirgula sp.]|nr:hypothetical protein [Methylovirgula sp.]